MPFRCTEGLFYLISWEYFIVRWLRRSQSEERGITIGHRLQNKGPEDQLGPGVYKEKSHILEGPHIQFEY